MTIPQDLAHSHARRRLQGPPGDRAVSAADAVLEPARLARALGCRAVLKCENLNPTGAFKVRGGVNLLASLGPDERARGVVAASTGNHGQSVAYAARLFGVRATIFMPEAANPLKAEATVAMGADVIQTGRDFDAARLAAEEHADRHGLRYIHSSNEPLLVAGVATAALELLEAVPEIDVLFVPVGGGSGVLGAGVVARAVNPAIRVVGVQAEGAPAVYRSWREGRASSPSSVATFAEGLATREPFEMPLALFPRLVDEIMLVDDDRDCRRHPADPRHRPPGRRGRGAAPVAAALAPPRGARRQDRRNDPERRQHYQRATSSHPQPRAAIAASRCPGRSTMIGKRLPWLMPACVLAVLSAGCEATRRRSQSRRSSIPTARATGRSVSPRASSCPRRRSSRSGTPAGGAWMRCTTRRYRPTPALGQRAKYFTARGSFRSPRDIPPHYRYANDEVPEVGASELQRVYERKDYGFVVEHRWSEKVTDIVTLPGFLEARDKLLDILLPSRCGSSRRSSVRDTISPGSRPSSARTSGEPWKRHPCSCMTPASGVDPCATTRRWTPSWPAGWWPCRGASVSTRSMPRASWSRARSPSAGSEEFVRRVVMQHVRHRDGSALERPEVDSLIARARTDPNFMKPDKRQEERLKRFILPLLLRMMGLHNVPLTFLFRGSPRYDFALRLPGELIESNGTVFKNGRTRWTFTADRIFPEGYEMKARSLDIDREGQKKVLGRVAIDDEEKALEFLELVGDDNTLMEAVRKLKETGDRGALAEEKGRSFAQNRRAERLREMLFGR